MIEMHSLLIPLKQHELSGVFFSFFFNHTICVQQTTVYNEQVYANEMCNILTSVKLQCNHYVMFKKKKN